MNSITLIGMPGCGKSSLGAYLARRSGREFIDLDREIEARTGAPPSKMITQMGEAAFREIECEVTAEIDLRTGLVIATGGGTILRPENVQALRQNGKLLWVVRDIACLPTENRPLSCNLEALWQARKPAYEHAADEIIYHSEDWKAVQNAAWEVFA